jgi:hypothetical protein
VSYGICQANWNSVSDLAVNAGHRSGKHKIVWEIL